MAIVNRGAEQRNIGQSDAPPNRAQPILRRSERIAARTLDGQAFIVVIDTQNLHALNDVGSFVWDRLEGKTQNEVTTEVCEVFAVEWQEASKDVANFLSELTELGAVEAVITQVAEVPAESVPAASR